MDLPGSLPPDLPPWLLPARDCWTGAALPGVRHQASVVPLAIGRAATGASWRAGHIYAPRASPLHPVPPGAFQMHVGSLG